jgi:hypothetical protein
VLEKMDADLRPANMAAAKLTDASLLREFLEHQLAPLWQYSLPIWRPHPSPAALADEDLAAVLQSLVGAMWRGWRALLRPCSSVMTGSR